MSLTIQPLIGITCGLTHNTEGAPIYQLAQTYTRAVQKAGGLPLMIPFDMDETGLSSLLSRLDGVILSGGGDIDPQYFNGTSHPKVYGISPERDALEISLINLALGMDKPLLAICRGIQVLNVALGGDLYTHIQDQVEHSLKHDWFPKFPRDKLAHTIRIKSDSKLDQIVNADEIKVNSLHHQGISRVGNSLIPTAFAPDGLVEGLEVAGASFALGVQWHPECLPDDPRSQDLFKAFIDACG